MPGRTGADPGNIRPFPIAMARDRLNFRERDLRTGVESREAGRSSIARIEIRHGGVVLFIGEPAGEFDSVGLMNQRARAEHATDEARAAVRAELRPA